MKSLINNQASEIGRGGHRGEYLLLEESSYLMFSRSLHFETIAGSKSANGKLMNINVMSFVCLDSCKTRKKRGTELTKGSGKQFFREFLGFQSNAVNDLEFQSVQCMEKTSNKMMEEKVGSRSRIPRKGLKRMSMPAAGMKFWSAGTRA